MPRAVAHAGTRDTLQLDDLRERCGTNADSRILCRKQACAWRYALLPLVRAPGLAEDGFGKSFVEAGCRLGLERAVDCL